jgi:hypothetical protein
MANITADEPVPVANFQVLCPEPGCGAPVTITVMAQLSSSDLRELVLSPDVTDIWAHSWTHWQAPITED